MPLPNMTLNTPQVEQEKNLQTVPQHVESVETNPRPVQYTQEPPKQPPSKSQNAPKNTLNDTETEVFVDPKKKKLLEHLAKCREKSVITRKKIAEERRNNKKPRGRPKKDDVNTPEPVPVIAPVVVREKVLDRSYEIDYDRIINGVHDKYIKHKETKTKKPIQYPTPVQYHYQPPPQQPAFDKHSFEQKVREDERKKLQEEINRVKASQENDRVRRQTKDYYNKLPPMNMRTGSKWDNLFN